MSPHDTPATQTKTENRQIMKKKMTIQPATKQQAPEIASLIMLAMSHECCQYFAGAERSLDDFHRMMTELVEMNESLYSYQHTLVATTARGELAGICVAYDGKHLRRWREAFYDAARRHLGRNLEGMDDETQAGEYYVDSLAVKPEYRRQGVARQLLRAVISEHGNDQPVGLLVDQGNPGAERMYQQVGFRYAGDAQWGGHAMRHLQYPVKCAWARADELSEKYHDEEWGVPVHDEQTHYMFLLMESMSCGLSWQMMLRRREIFRQCFAAFDARQVATFGEADVERIMATEGMIRSRRKIEGMIANARAFVKVSEEFGSFDSYIWSFTQRRSLIYPSHADQWVTRNELSDRVASDMKRRGFCYVGSTIIYSHLQAIGIINDHRPGCFRYAELARGCTVVEE